MTFGYITLFAAAFPGGVMFSRIILYLESKTDIYMFERTARRPFSRKAHNIGSWEIAINMITICSAFTNIVLCCYASDQIDFVLPWLKDLREDSATSILTIFSIEHILIATILIIRLSFSSQPAWLRIFINRMRHKNIKKH